MLLQRSFLERAVPDATIILGGRWDSVREHDDFEGKETEVAVSIDSRTIRQGEIFAALKGDRTDGHVFIGTALSAGAIALVIETSWYERVKQQHEKLLHGKLIICVRDVTEALYNLARTWRDSFTCPIVAVTGSIGKTTTKEIVRSIFIAGRVKGFVSHKNENNPLGLCLNILRMLQRHEVGVFEVATAERGRIAVLASILRPTIALITCVAHSHGKNLGSLTDISLEKRSIFSFFKPHDVGIICGDQTLLSGIHYNHPIARFGFKTKNQVQARKIRYDVDALGRPVTHFVFKWYQERANVTLKGVHDGRVMNALAASTIAYFLNIPFEAVLEGITSYHGVEQRFEERRIKKFDGKIISDCYNANPESMKAALKAFDHMNYAMTKIAVLGDMLELGDKEVYWHRQVGRFLNKTSTVQHLLLVGSRAKYIAQTAHRDFLIHYAESWQDAIDTLKSLVDQIENPYILVKASHDMNLHHIVDYFTGSSMN